MYQGFVLLFIYFIRFYVFYISICKIKVIYGYNHTTGHELKNASALYEYVDASLALCMPGAIVLAGWPPLPWGQLGHGPEPPSIFALEEIGVSREKLEYTIDILFNLDSASPPMLMKGGSLRPAVYAAFASIVMY